MSHAVLAHLCTSRFLCDSQGRDTKSYNYRCAVGKLFIATHFVGETSPPGENEAIRQYETPSLQFCIVQLDNVTLNFKYLNNFAWEVIYTMSKTDAQQAVARMV